LTHTAPNTPNSVVVAFDTFSQEAHEIEKAEQAEGKLAKQNEEDKLMNSVLAGDKKSIDKAELIQEATNRNVGSFTPDLLFQQLTTNYSVAEQILGPKLIRLLTGYDPRYIEKNAKIPEFKKELRAQLEDTIQSLKQDKLIDAQGIISERGAEVGALVLMKDLDAFVTRESMGEKINKKTKHYGDRKEPRAYRKGDRYKDLHLRRSIHAAIKRGHKELLLEDLHTSEREGKGSVSVIYALDASASMKGQKIEMSKRAGITLAFNAIHDKDKVGLIVFGSDIKTAVPPTQDFSQLLTNISKIKASRQTDFANMIDKAIELFPPTAETKHLILLTDAMPTVGEKPEEETLKAISKARGAGITVSLIGIQLDKAGIQLAKDITRIGEGRFSLCKDLGELGEIVLEDYYAVR